MKRQKLEHPKNIQGYRNPTEEEKKKIYRYLQWDLQKKRKQLKFFRSIVACFAVATTAGTVGSVFTDQINIPEIVVTGLVSLMFWAFFIGIYKSLVVNSKLEVYARNGNFKVMDCIPYEHFYNLEPGRNDGSVQIQTLDGKHRLGNFEIDMETALLCESGKGKNLPMLLMYEEETKESRVFTERMLNRGSR